MAGAHFPIHRTALLGFLTFLCALLFALLALPRSTSALSNSLVISQVYGGGGNAGANECTSPGLGIGWNLRHVSPFIIGLQPPSRCRAAAGGETIVCGRLRQQGVNPSALDRRRARE
jgi:hypothetical protein